MCRFYVTTPFYLRAWASVDFGICRDSVCVCVSWNQSFGNTGGLLYFNIFDIGFQMSGYLSCLNCACKLAAATGKEKRGRKVLNKRGKQTKSTWEEEGSISEMAAPPFHVLEIKTLASSLPSSHFFIPSISHGPKSWGSIFKIYPGPSYFSHLFFLGQATIISWREWGLSLLRHPLTSTLLPYCFFFFFFNQKNPKSHKVSSATFSPPVVFCLWMQKQIDILVNSAYLAKPMCINLNICKDDLS